MSANVQWFKETCQNYFVMPETMPIEEWINEGNLQLPSNTAEPGVWSLDRASYQREIVKTISPEHPAQEVTLVFGSQMGKTTIENGIMCYLIDQAPCPIGFAFSDDKNLKNYIKNKFDPLLEANPRIKQKLKSSGTSRADAMDLKQFVGGFIKFMSGKSESSMRSDSMQYVLMDEVDGMGVTKGGDVRALLRKRMNTFGHRAKMVLSSTPLNDGVIYSYLLESTFNKYFVLCPHCKEEMTFEQDYFRIELVKGSDAVVKDAYMECPHCQGKIRESHKQNMLKESNGAHWKATNPNASPLKQGFYIPTFYAPVGWFSFKQIAQEYADAALKESGVDYTRLTTYYNTILAKPYNPGSSGMDWKILHDQADRSTFLRGTIPEDVLFLTTGGDVQGNRLEMSLFGWSKFGRRYPIDHFVFDVPQGQSIEVLDCEVWQRYVDEILRATFKRDDGVNLITVANALDSSYKPETIYAFRESLPTDLKQRFYPVKGYNKANNEAGYVPVEKRIHSKTLKTNTQFWSVPTSSLKHQVYQHLKESIDEDKENMPFHACYPTGYDQEYYMQLYSEEFVQNGNKGEWVKVRDRNEILDCTIYNYAMYYLLGCYAWSGDTWDTLRDQIKTPLKQGVAKSGRRSRSSGFKV